MKVCTAHTSCSVSWFGVCLYLGITDATINTVLADNRGLRLFQLELSRQNVENERLAPLDHAHHLTVTKTLLIVRIKSNKQIGKHKITTNSLKEEQL